MSPEGYEDLLEPTALAPTALAHVATIGPHSKPQNAIQMEA